MAAACSAVFGARILIPAPFFYSESEIRLLQSISVTFPFFCQTSKLRAKPVPEPGVVRYEVARTRYVANTSHAAVSAVADGCYKRSTLLMSVRAARVSDVGGGVHIGETLQDFGRSGTHVSTLAKLMGSASFADAAVATHLLPLHTASTSGNGPASTCLTHVPHLQQRAFPAIY